VVEVDSIGGLERELETYLKVINLEGFGVRAVEWD